MKLFAINLLVVVYWLTGGRYIIAADLEWWQNGVIYQIFPRSFKDSDGDGIGDLKGIEEKAEYFKDLGISAVWLTPIFESPMIDFGYDVSDFYKIATIFGTIDDFKSLKRKLDSLNIRLLLDFVPNHTSDQCEWFKKSVDKIDPYTDFYVWRNPAGWNGSLPIPPNNWVSVFNGPAWTYNEQRRQYYLHQFAVQQPDLNFRNAHLVREIEKILIYWLDHGVDGFRMDSVAYLLEHPQYPDEPTSRERTSSGVLTHDSLIHAHSKDWTENYELVYRFHKIVDTYSSIDGKSRIIINEAYTSLENTLKFYDLNASRNMPFNFFLITDVNDHSDATDFMNVVRKWIDNMPKNCWANWVIGNHDNSRVATRFGAELVDGMHMLSFLLPGTAITYNGEEIGMEDGRVRWDQTLDPGARNAGYENFRKFNRDPARTPFQWDDSTSAGFSTNAKPWLPVNSNYWRLNLASQKNASRSHYHVYKRLLRLRYHPTIQRGDLNIFTSGKWILIFIRRLQDHDTFATIINFGSEEERIDMGAEIQNISDTIVVHTSSVNSEHEIGQHFPANAIIKMRPKSAVVLTSGSVPKIGGEKNSSVNDNGRLRNEF